MNVRHLIIIGVAGIVGIGFFGFGPFIELPLLCDDQILGVDDCRDYLQEKYSGFPMFEHFDNTHPDAMPVYFESDMLIVKSVTASSILDEKTYAFLRLDFADSVFTYTCHNHNLGEDYLVAEIASPTTEVLDTNHCGILNQLEY